MKKLGFVVLICLTAISNSYAVDHSMHGGNASSSGGGSAAGACPKVQFSNFKPEHLAQVPPESEFSFFALGIKDTDQIQITAKGLPVEITTEKRDTFYKVTGKLPAELKETTARVNIKIVNKFGKCNTEDGWLINITN